MRLAPGSSAFKQQEVFIQDKDWEYDRMDSDEHPAPENGIGDGVGLSRREKIWRGKQVHGLKSSKKKENAYLAPQTR